MAQGGHFSEPDPSARPITTINFGSGYLKGYFVTDSLTLGDPEEDGDSMKVPDWTFGLVFEQTSFNKNYDAIIGLAFPGFAEPGVTPFMDALMQAKVLDQNVFTFSMSMNPDEESMLQFGAIDPDSYTGEITYY